MTDTMGRMHSDAQFAGSSSVPAHVEMMGFLAAEWAFTAHWSLMHWFVCGLMLFVLAVQLALTCPFHAMPQRIPLKGIDWFGSLLWIALCLQVTYVLNYGDWLDWWHSPRIRLLCSAFFLAKSFLVDQAYCLIFVYGHNDRFARCPSHGGEFDSFGKSAYSAAFFRC